MLGVAARRMGFRVHVYEPSAGCPAEPVSDVVVNAPYTDSAALRRFASAVDLVTLEFENVPLAALEAVAELCPVRPRGEVLHICQNREREKNFLRRHGFPHAPFRVVDSAESLAAALAETGVPAVLKTADFGYDGKGQVRIDDATLAEAVWRDFGAPRGVLEKWIAFEREVSVIVARGPDGRTAAFPAAENLHRRHILDLSIVPARLPETICAEASRMAVSIAGALDASGLLAVEFFFTSDGTLLVNELAPRPHNSGHYTLDACITSQFEQQLRAVSGLPLGATDLLTPVVMWNLLGDLWRNGEPDWNVILSEPRAKLHLYGKREARPGRKMGHVSLLAPVEEALEIIERFRVRLGEGVPP